MVVSEFALHNKADAEELVQAYDEAVFVDVNSLSGSDIVQVLIPLTALMATIAPIVIKLIESKTCSIKCKGIEISGLSPNKTFDVIERLEKLQSEEASNE